MVFHLLRTKTIENDLLKLVSQKAEGIPFFIEEFVKSLKDLKIIVKKNGTYRFTPDIQEVTIPSTIQDVIMARADALPEDAREILQIGSVIGRTFTYELQKEITGISEHQLLIRMNVLRNSELLYERGIHPESVYIFKHALTQEIIYNSLLTRRKKKLHEKVGNGIEELYKKNIEKYYGVLADNYMASENYEKAADYSKLAAKKAEKKVSLFDSIVYTRKGIECLEKLYQTDEVQKKIIDSRAILGLYYLQINYPVEAKKAVESIVQLAIDRDYKRRLSQIYIVMGVNSYMVEEDFDKTFHYLHDALEISEKLNDILSIVMATYWLGLGLALNCEYKKALLHLERALEINELANAQWGVALVKSVISAYVYNWQGKIERGYRTSSDALRIAEESDDIYSKAFAYTHHGASCYYKGLFQKAEKNLLIGVDFSEKMNLFACSAMAHSYLGNVYFYTGKCKKSYDHLVRANSHLRSCKILPSWVRMNKICMAKAKVSNYEKDVDLGLFNKYFNENKFRLYNGRMPREFAEITLNIDYQHLSTAESWISKAIEADKQFGMMWYLGKDYAIYAEILKRKGEQSKAKENLSKAIEIFKECGADGWVKKTEKELPSLS